MGVINKLAITLLLGLPLLGCKTVVNKFAFHPDNVDVIATSELPYGVQELTITTEDDVEITSLYLPAPESDKLVIYFHGNAGNIYHRIPSLLQLNEFGVHVIGVSYRGYGKSEGRPSEYGVNEDGNAVFQHAVQRMGFAEENIIIFGRSIGTTVAINTAQNKRLRGLVLVTPLTSGKDQAKATGLGSISSLAGSSFDNISKIENIDSPLLVIHGTNDRVIPYAMGKQIFDHAKGKKTFVKIDGANHNNLHDAYGQQYWDSIRWFIKEP
ncbi:MAG: hypothetical protein COA78_23835 [Blastopirellula sp.]|nr:MAG: hypothetical protein COA78_23835 [Blastopirellula sp.]